MEKTNANVIHSALQLPKGTSAYDFNGALKSGIGAIKTALTSNQTVLLVQSIYVEVCHQAPMKVKAEMCSCISDR